MSKKRPWRNREAGYRRWVTLAIRVVKSVAKREGYPPEEDSTGKARERAYASVTEQVKKTNKKIAPRGRRKSCKRG